MVGDLIAFLKGFSLLCIWRAMLYGKNTLLLFLDTLSVSVQELMLPCKGTCFSCLFKTSLI